MLTKTIADLEKVTTEMKARLATLNPCIPDHHCEACPHAPVPTPSVVPAPTAASELKPKNFALIQKTLMGEKVYVESYGERLIGTIDANGIQCGTTSFKTPTGFCSAHSARITEKHPQPTKSGSGWQFVKILEGPYKDKCLSIVYAAIQGVETQLPASPLTPPTPLVTEAPKNKMVLNPMAAQPFVCMRNPKHTPTAEDIKERGGHLEGGKFKFTMDHPDAQSPSGACCTVLKRKEYSISNQWDGPRHVFILDGGIWKPYSAMFPKAVTA